MSNDVTRALNLEPTAKCECADDPLCVTCSGADCDHDCEQCESAIIEARGNTDRLVGCEEGRDWARDPQEQPAPIPSDAPATWDLVIADIANRDDLGARKYGVRHQPHNGRDQLRDTYEEILDAAVYLRAAIYERDGR